jgi:hypothetical protein
MKNAALAQLDWLVGEWDLTMTDAWFLDSPDVKVHDPQLVVDPRRRLVPQPVRAFLGPCV